ncbi:MAG: hypothetical protein M1370_06825 [Bacteroidetes bacterium]|nr:hypothetical protein [Bacteroidota bacterium]MCL5027150.1 hypothetical protein [Chloroflexota bacterium]
MEGEQEKAQEQPTEGERRRRHRMGDMTREFDEMQEKMAGMLPDEFVQHMRAAQKEMLLAMRSLLDAGVSKIEERERRRAARRARKVEVE